MGKYESEHARYRRYTQRVQTCRSVWLGAICKIPGSLFRTADACVGCGRFRPVASYIRVVGPWKNFSLAWSQYASPLPLLYTCKSLQCPQIQTTTVFPKERFGNEILDG